MRADGRRDQLEIFREVLVIINDGEHVPTRICRAANVSYSDFERYMEDLLAKNVVAKVNTQSKDRRRTFDFVLTNRGGETVARRVGWPWHERRS